MFFMESQTKNAYNPGNRANFDIHDTKKQVHAECLA